MLEKKTPVRDGTWNGKEIELLNKHLFMSSKPVVYLVNIGRDEYIKKKNMSGHTYTICSNAYQISFADIAL